MKIVSRIWKLEFSKLWRLLWIGLKNPLFVFPTNRASIRTMQICDRIYGDEHHGDGKANAFRHALWNILIARRVFKVTKSTEKALAWTEKITTLHEVLMPNQPLEKEMDLHNNKMGRHYFFKLQDASEEEIIQFLLKKTKEALPIKNVQEVQNKDNYLVYIDKEDK